MTLSLDAKVYMASNVLYDALRLYPHHAGVYALVSGGKDSTAMAHLAAHYGFRLDGIIHINTGIGIEATRAYVRDFAQWLDRPLHEFHPPVSYRDIVLEHGFPAPTGHAKTYIRLKERALRQARARFQRYRGQPVIFLTGVRKAESQRRMGYVQPIMEDSKNGKIIWVAPLIDFETSDLLAYHAREAIPANPVTEHLHMSGECLCGAFAHENELAEIGFFYPETAAQIRALEREVATRGIARCTWGPSQYPGWKGRMPGSAAGMLCQDCQLPKEAA